ncbi:hypothetical protein VIGAN_01089500 [Vigna angularis var. angularis]|uniref:Uncharacterized protein n=1 Tax=Vigna angularis var. angularis TaxID=157739 RepID=A0A0S3QYI8_PHAAN|nr:hypothetical protein VIGAN_01089500 [Vigna angularis var. angularis]
MEVEVRDAPCDSVGRALINGMATARWRRCSEEVVSGYRRDGDVWKPINGEERGAVLSHAWMKNELGVFKPAPYLIFTHP